MDEGAEGEDIRIARGDGATFRLVPVLDTEPEALPKRRFGVLAGQITMASDFDAPLDDFEPYARLRCCSIRTHCGGFCSTTSG